MKLTSWFVICYNNKVVKGTVRNLLWACAAAFLLGLPLSGQTVDDLLTGLQGSFASKDAAAYAGAFSPEIRERESAAMSIYLNKWRMNQVLFHRATRDSDKEGEPGIFLQVFFQNDDSAMLEIWRVTFAKAGDGWRIRTKEVMGNITSLFKIRIPSGSVERAARVEIRHQDIRITFQDAWVFHDNIEDLETALVIIGRGQFHFSPSSDTERHQLELRYRKNFIQDTLEYGYFRFSDSFFRGNITIEKAPPEKTPKLSQADSNRAYSLFTRYYPNSFTIENSLTGGRLSFIPRGDQAVFEMKGKKTGDVAYIFSPFSDDEIHFVGRDPDQVINLYTPEIKGEEGLKSFFVSFGEKFDVKRCDVEVDFQPDKRYLSARARIEVSAQIDAVENLKFNFNPDFEILRIFDQEGRELFFTLDKQRKLLYIYFIKPLEKNATGSIEIYYRGTIEPPGLIQDVISGGQYNETISFLEPRYDTYLYSQSAYWYPQPAEEDYFLASLHFSIPPGYTCVANGELVEQSRLESVRRVMTLEKVGNTLYRFETKFPVKYLSFLVGRLDRMSNGNGGGPIGIQGYVATEIRAQRKGLVEDARAIVQNYSAWFGPFPYEKLDIVQRLWPTTGGHSPASFIVLNELPRIANAHPLVTANSPVDMPRFREYYLAHEIAHQWWGQAVTWERYRDQWLSEGLSQFAAALHVRAKFGEVAYAGILKKFSQWTERLADWGPITLGSRLSYLNFDAYQAIVYDKAAVALNMLRDLIGEEAFFRGLRGFFEKYKYRPARTNNFIQAMEQTSGRDLQAFFKGWFDTHVLPEIDAAPEILKRGDAYIVKIRVNQTRGNFVFPLWVQWEENKKTVRKMMEIGAATQEFEFPAAFRPARIKINPDRLVPGKFK
jgi:hypothetical protein